MKRLFEVVAVVVAVVIRVMLMTRVSGRLEYVGGKDGWNPGVDYGEWASTKSLFVGDWIGFRYNKFQYDVIEVNQTGYEQCNNNFMLKNVTKGGGKDVYQLNDTKTYYFICTKGYCWNGMKVAVNVTVPQPPAPSPQGNESSSDTSVPLWVLAISMLLAFFMNV